MIELDKLKVVYEIVKSGSFTGAGRALNVSQSAVSRSIIRFEEDLNLKIFDRNTRRMRLTREGEKLYFFARKILHELSSIEASLYSREEVADTILSIYTTPLLAHMGLAQALKCFEAKQPAIRYNIHTSLDAPLKQGEITLLPFKVEGNAIINRLLGKVRLRLWASHKYVKKHGSPQSLKDLESHRLLICREDMALSGARGGGLLQRGGAELNARAPFIIMDSQDVLLRMVEKGLGIAALPLEFLKDKGSRLVEVLSDYKGPTQEIYCSYPSEMKAQKWLPPLLASFEEAFNGKE